MTFYRCLYDGGKEAQQTSASLLDVSVSVLALTVYKPQWV